MIARRQRMMAVAEMIAAERAREVAQQARLEADRPKVSEAQAVLDFFRENVLAADPTWELKANASPRAALERAETAIESVVAEPAVEATIRGAVGESYLSLGEPAKAIRQLDRALTLRRKALGVDNPDTLRSMSRLADAHMAGGQVDRALPLYLEALSRGKAAMGAEDLEVLAFMNNLGRAYLASEPALAEPVLRDALAAWMKKARDDWHTYEAAQPDGGLPADPEELRRGRALPDPGL